MSVLTLGDDRNCCVNFAGVAGSEDSNFITGLAPFATIASMEVCIFELIGLNAVEIVPLFCSKKLFGRFLGTWCVLAPGEGVLLYNRGSSKYLCDSNDI